MTTDLPRATKRLLDILGAVCGLVLAAPILLVAAVAIRLTMGSPVLFRQLRPGRDGRAFTIVKLRTMRTPRPGEPMYHTDADRLTPLGRFLRRTSIDELPELWNVLTGAMSLVGPRPLLMDYLDQYTASQRRRHDVRPGITGWAQVNGRQDIPISERLELDVWYVDHWSLALDARIVAMTISQIVRGHGVRSGQDVAAVDDLGFLTRPRATRDQAPRLAIGEAGFALRGPEARDRDRLLLIKNDRPSALQLVGHNDGYTAADIERWIERHTTTPDEIVWVIVDETDAAVGHIGLYHLDRRAGTADFGILIGPAWQGRGVGEVALRRVLDHAWGELGLQRVALTVLASNDRAIRLYRRVGFEEEGRMRRAQLKAGQFVDVLLMAILRD